MAVSRSAGTTLTQTASPTTRVEPTLPTRLSTPAPHGSGLSGPQPDSPQKPLVALPVPICYVRASGRLRPVPPRRGVV